MPDLLTYRAEAEFALIALIQSVPNGTLSPIQQQVLRHNWRYSWCDKSIGPATPTTLVHDFKLYLGSIFGLEDGLENSTDAELIIQQYLSSLYWSLTMLMKTAYVPPDTALEKVIGMRVLTSPLRMVTLCNILTFVRGVVCLCDVYSHASGGGVCPSANWSFRFRCYHGHGSTSHQNSRSKGRLPQR